MPYISGFDAVIFRILNKKSNIQIVLFVENTSYKIIFLNVKDLTDKCHTVNIIYRILCSNCSMIYIGQTFGHFF